MVLDEVERKLSSVDVLIFVVLQNVSELGALYTFEVALKNVIETFEIDPKTM